MQINDVINGIFEFGGAILCWMNFFRLIKDKEVKGVYWPVTGFFAVWGIWNCFYYPSLNQWFSFAGGVVLAAGNISWVILVIFYLYFYKKK